MTKITLLKSALVGLFSAFVLGGFSGVVSAAEAIKVGVALPMTGPYAGDGVGYDRGITMAVDEVNAAGGLLGRPLEMVRFDTQDFAPELVMRAADQLVGNDKVDVVHGGWAGWGQDVVAYGKYDVPFFMWDASILAIEEIRKDPVQHSNVFQLNDIEKPQAIDIFDNMLSLPYEYPNKTVAVITADDSWGTEMGSGIKERAAENGWEVVVDEVVPYGTREWGPILTKIRATSPGWIHLEIVSSPDLITFFNQFNESPTNTLISMGYGLSLPDFASNIGEQGDGLIGMTAGMPMPVGPTPEANAWIERFREKFEAEPAAGSFPVYTGVMIWASAVKAVGDPTNYEAINDYIANTPHETVVGTWTFDADHKVPLSSEPVLHLQIQDGKAVTIDWGAGQPYLDYEFRTPPWIKQ